MSSRASRTLYVGNVPGDIREREVADLFYKYGRIVHIDLKIPPRPSGHCFIEFEDARDAEDAIRDAIRGRDGYNFDGNRLRVELARGGRGQSSTNNGDSSRASQTLCVGNLPGDIRKREVEDLFYKYGRIVDVDLKIPPGPPGHCFIEFEDARDAEEAIRDRNRYNFDGNRLRVELARDGRGQSSTNDGDSSRASQTLTLSVGNLPGDIMKREVEDLFYKYGRIVDIDLKIPPRPPGHCFIEFEDARDAEDAIRDAIRGRDGYNFDGNRLRVELAGGGRGQSSTNDSDSSRASQTLCVGNLPCDIKKREVEGLFDEYGRIVHIDLKIPPGPPGHCFIEFEDAPDAEDAIRDRDGYNFDGNRLRVELARGGRGQSSTNDGDISTDSPSSSGKGSLVGPSLTPSPPRQGSSEGSSLTPSLPRQGSSSTAESPPNVYDESVPVNPDDGSVPVNVPVNPDDGSVPVNPDDGSVPVNVPVNPDDGSAPVNVPVNPSILV